MHDFSLENLIQTEFFHQEKYLRKFQLNEKKKIIRESLFESIYSAIQRRRKICLSAENNGQ